MEKEKTTVSLAKEYLDSLPEVKIAIQKSAIESIVVGLMVGFAKDYHSTFKSDISDEEINLYAEKETHDSEEGVYEIDNAYKQGIINGAKFLRDKVNFNKIELLIEFMKWYKNTVPIGTMKESKEIVDEFLNKK